MNKLRKYSKITASSTNSPLFYKDDEAWLYELIRELIARKYFVTRPSKAQLKHRKANFYYSTDVITIDGVGRHEKRGQQAFLDLLEQMYPRKQRLRGNPLLPDDALLAAMPIEQIDLRALSSCTTINDNRLLSDETPF